MFPEPVYRDPPGGQDRRHVLSHAHNRRHRGIGIETVRALASAGARVLLTSPNVYAAQQVAQQLGADGVLVRIFLTAPPQADCIDRNLLLRTWSSFGKISNTEVVRMRC